MAVIDQYKNNPEAAKSEILRAKQVYEEKKAAGDMAGAQAAADWANSVRAASGLDKDPNYGADKTIEQVKSAINSVQNNSATTSKQSTTTPTPDAVKSVGNVVSSAINSVLGYTGTSPAVSSAVNSAIGTTVNATVNKVSEPNPTTNTTPTTTTNKTPTVDDVLKQLSTMIQENNKPIDYKQLVPEILSMLPQATPTPVLSWEQAMERAKTQLNPIYDERLQAVDKNVDYANIKSGFYGQLPGEALKRETLIKEEQGRASAIGSLANNLVNQSEESARAAEQLELQKQAQSLNVIQNAIAQAASQKNTNVANIINLLNALQNKEDREFNKSVTTAGITGYFNPYEGMEIDPKAFEYPDIQAEIDRRRAINPSDPFIAQLEAARAYKVLSSPDLREKYGDQYMTQDAKLRKLESEMNTFKFNLEKQYLPAQYQAQYEKAMAEIEQIKAYDPTIENKINQAKLDEIYANISRINADIANSTKETNANIAYKEKSLALEEKKLNQSKSNIDEFKINDYFSTIENMRKETKVVGTDKLGGEVKGPAYTEEDIKKYIQNLYNSGRINEEETRELLARAGFTKKN